MLPEAGEIFQWVEGLEFGFHKNIGVATYACNPGTLTTHGKNNVVCYPSCGSITKE